MSAAELELATRGAATRGTGTAMKALVCEFTELLDAKNPNEEPDSVIDTPPGRTSDGPFQPNFK
jgi:hypothetical protein